MCGCGLYNGETPVIHWRTCFSLATLCEYPAARCRPIGMHNSALSVHACLLLCPLSVHACLLIRSPGVRLIGWQCGSGTCKVTARASATPVSQDHHGHDHTHVLTHHIDDYVSPPRAAFLRVRAGGRAGVLFL